MFLPFGMPSLFTRKKIEVIKPKEPTWNETLVAKMIEWRKIGEIFNYCGREFVVTGHANYVAGMYYIVAVPLLKADYCDDIGVIHQMEFRSDMIKAIMESNP